MIGHAANAEIFEMLQVETVLTATTARSLEKINDSQELQNNGLHSSRHRSCVLYTPDVRFRAILPLGGAEGRIQCLHPFRWGKLTLVPCQTWEQRHAESFVRLSVRPVGGLQSLPSMSTRAPSLFQHICQSSLDHLT